MKRLLRHWDRLKKALLKKHLALFFDYDGTLAPIADTPAKAAMPAEIKKLLKRLLDRPYCSMAVISGRGLDDIRRMVGIKEITYAGNHGLEIEGPKIKYINQAPPGLKSVIRQIKKELEKNLSGVKGLLLEDKGLSLGVHYRLVDKNKAPLVKEKFEQAARIFINRRKLRAIYGKKVLELRPAVEWDKGKVVLWLLARKRFSLGEKNIIPVYIGDDSTDEDAFRALKKKGLTVFVGSPFSASQAKYCLKDTAEVVKFLNKVLELHDK